MNKKVILIMAIFVSALALILITQKTSKFKPLQANESEYTTGWATTAFGYGKVRIIPRPGGGNSGGGQRECPIEAIWRYYPPGLLIADYDPEIMQDVEIAVSVIDSDPGDVMIAAFIGADCGVVRKLELGEEYPGRVFSFKVKDEQSLKIFVYSVDSLRATIVNNPIVGTQFIDDNVAMNLLGVIAPKTPWKAAVEPATAIHFNNIEWALLPNKAMNTYLLKDPALGELKIYDLYNVFEPDKNLGINIFAEKPINVKESCAGAVRKDNRLGFNYGVILPEYNILGIYPIFEHTATDLSVTVKGYNVGGNSLEFGSPTYNDPAVGPSRTFLTYLKGPDTSTKPFVKPYPDNQPQSMVTTTGEIFNYENGIIEDWIALTNVGDQAETYVLEFYEAKSCGQIMHQVKVQPKQTRFARVSHITGSMQLVEGALIISSASGSKNLMAEKYGIKFVDYKVEKIVYKLNALTPYWAEKDWKNFDVFKKITYTAPSHFIAQVPTIVTNDQNFRIKVINFAAIRDQSKTSQIMQLEINNGEEVEDYERNTKYINVHKSGCVIDITSMDLQGLERRRAWPANPDYIGITGNFLNFDPMGPADVVIISEEGITNEPAHQYEPPFQSCCYDRNCWENWKLPQSYHCGKDPRIQLLDISGVCMRPILEVPMAPPEPAKGICPPPNKLFARPDGTTICCPQGTYYNAQTDQCELPVKEQPTPTPVVYYRAPRPPIEIFLIVGLLIFAIALYAYAKSKEEKEEEKPKHKPMHRKRR